MTVPPAPGARAAEPADLERLEELGRAAAEVVATQRGGPLHLLREAAPATRAGFVAAMEAEHRLVLVGTIGPIDGAEAVVGFLVASVVQLAGSAPVAEVEALYVEPGAREVGVGEQLLGAAVGWAEGRGCRGIDAWALPGDRSTKNFFETFGLTARAILVHRDLGAG